MKILVVNDSEFNRQLIYWLLTDAGYDVIEAENGLEAVDSVSLERPDLILMDVCMPVMNGFQATRSIRELSIGKCLPIIFLSAALDKETLDECSTSGGNDFLGMPIDDRLLLDKIREYRN